MILRRVIKHVRNQEWTAIAIDFLIVVVGVFVGLQVSNWNAAVEEGARAAVYSERLRGEVQAEYEYAHALIDYHTSLSHATDEAYRGLTQKAELDDETILINAFRASQYNWYERRRSTFDEIVASGSLALITDKPLRDAANGIYGTPLFGIIQSEGQVSAFRELFRMAIEPELHDELSRNCGDKEYESSGEAVGLLTLDYDCTISASAEEMAEGVRALRSDPAILKALRLRNAQVDGRITDLVTTVEIFGVNEMFSDKFAP